MSQPRPAFLTDPYCRGLSSQITGHGEDQGRPFVYLQRTLFYPEGGGQPADHGTLIAGEIELAVVDVQKSANGIKHFVEPGSDLSRLDAVELSLDWQRRFDHMQQHSAQHVLTAEADRLWGIQTTSFHLGTEICDIELDTPQLSEAQILELEQAVARVIRDDHTITPRMVAPQAVETEGIRSRGLPAGHTGQVRVIDINGVDQCACGGTHVRSTCELEALQIIDTESIRGGTRLFWVAGARVRRRLRRHEERNRRLRQILQTSDDELAGVASLKLEQQKQDRKRMERLEKRWAEATAEALAARTGPWIEAHFEDTSAGTLGQIARSVVATAPQSAIFLTAEDTKGASFVLAAGKRSEADIPAAGQAVARLLDGRGGGKGPFFQGRAGSLTHRAQAVAELSGD